MAKSHANDLLEMGFMDECKNYRLKYTQHELVTPDLRARLAMALIEKWALVAAIPDGEDSSGRAKCRLSTAQETVDRAVEMAGLAVSAFKERGWLVESPSLTELNTEKNLD